MTRTCRGYVGERKKRRKIKEEKMFEKRRGIYRKRGEILFGLTVLFCFVILMVVRLVLILVSFFSSSGTRLGLSR